MQNINKTYTYIQNIQQHTNTYKNKYTKYTKINELCKNMINIQDIQNIQKHTTT